MAFFSIVLAGIVQDNELEIKVGKESFGSKLKSLDASVTQSSDALDIPTITYQSCSMLCMYLISLLGKASPFLLYIINGKDAFYVDKGGFAELRNSVGLQFRLQLPLYNFALTLCTHRKAINSLWNSLETCLLEGWSLRESVDLPTASHSQ